MMTKDLSAGQENKVDKSRKMFVSTALLAALWVLLSLFVLPCTGAEAAVPSRKEIPGDYDLQDGSPWLSVLFYENGTLMIFPGDDCTYNPDTGTATSKYIQVQFTKDVNGKVSMRGKYFDRKIDAIRIPRSGKNTDSASKQEQKKEEKKLAPALPTENTGDGQQQNDDYDDHDDLPESDAEKATAAVGTALGGALLGGAAGAIGGAAGGAAGSAGGSYYGPSEGGYGPEEGGYGPEEGGYGPAEGGYGPAEGGYGPVEGGYGPGDYDSSNYVPNADYDSNNDYDNGDYDSNNDYDNGDYAPNADYDSNDSEESNNDGDESENEKESDNEDMETENEEESDNTDEESRNEEEPGNEDDISGDVSDDDGDDSGSDDSSYDGNTDDNSDRDNSDGYDSESSDSDSVDDSQDSDDNYDSNMDSGNYDDQNLNDDGNAEESQDKETDGKAETPPPDADQDDSLKDAPDNMTVNGNGDIEVTTPTGEKILYTRNEDGSYNAPTHTEEGFKLSYTDEDGNKHDAEPGFTSQEEILKGAQWYKENEDAMRAEQAEEDARQQAERDILAAENAAWLEKERAINNQKSQTSIDLENELRQMKVEYEHDIYFDKMRMKYGTVEDYVTGNKDNIMKDAKRQQIKANIEGGYHEQEAAKWENRIVTAQQTKFASDMAVFAYTSLTHDPTLGTVYNAATNYGETMTDAYINNKDMDKAFWKATRDTAIDTAANQIAAIKAPLTGGLQVTGGVFGAVGKRVNDNLYNGRDMWDGTQDAALQGGIMGLVGKGASVAATKAQGTVLGMEIGGSSQNMKANVNVDVDDGLPKKPTIAELRSGKSMFKNMTKEQIKMQTMEDVQANRSMNEVRELNKIHQQMSAIEKSNPRNFQNDSKYQELSQQFKGKSLEVSESKVSIDRLGATGKKDLLQRYNNTKDAYNKEVLGYRDESLAQETGLKRSDIHDLNVTGKKPGSLAPAHDVDSSPHVVTSDGKTVDFDQKTGDNAMVRGIYKAEHGRFPKNAAEYAEGQRLKEVRDFTNVSTKPSDTHEIRHNPDAYVGSGKGEVGKVLKPEKYGTPDKGTGALNEQTAIHKQATPYDRAQNQYAKVQEMTNELKTNQNLTAAQKTEMGKEIKALGKQWASNDYEATRTTGKELKVTGKINEVNMKNGLGDGISDDAKQIGAWAKQVQDGTMSNTQYKQLVEENYGSVENAQKIVARTFRDTNK